MTVYTSILHPGDSIDTAVRREWINCRDVQETAMMAAHRAARDGWRGRIKVAAWTDAMLKDRAAYVAIVDIDANSPEPRPTDDRRLLELGLWLEPAFNRALPQGAGFACFSTNRYEEWSFAPSPIEAMALGIIALAKENP